MRVSVYSVVNGAETKLGEIRLEGDGLVAVGDSPAVRGVLETPCYDRKRGYLNAKDHPQDFLRALCHQYQGRFFWVTRVETTPQVNPAPQRGGHGPAASPRNVLGAPGRKGG